MLVTEEQAKQKWCPMARIDGNNRHYGSQNHIGRCISSECMFWRWKKTFEFGAEPTLGYCGLAGGS